jgi:hypothetical protein
MATPPATIRNPEHALDGSHCATDAGPDRAANHTADRAANPVAFRRALLRAAHDALRMPDMGDCEQGESACRGRKMKLYRPTGGQCRCSDPRLHLNSFCSVAIAPTGRTSVTPVRLKSCAPVVNSGRDEPSML